ncbi:MAG: hypothetical protein JW939_07530, partial [Candidatus Thermoplasmatota archaeon]|nr:hypothetical protein [Candidatus Thermoplasmatota archaeon]
MKKACGVIALIKWDPVLIMILVFLLGPSVMGPSMPVVSLYPIRTPGEEIEVSPCTSSNSFDAPARGISPRTAVVFSPDAPGQMSMNDNLSGEEGVAFTFERNSLEYFASLPATYQTTQDHNDGRVIVQDGPFIFVSHLISSGQWISFWLSRYDIRMDRWDGSVEVHNVSGYQTASCEIALAGGQLFYGLYLISSNGQASGIYIKQIEVEDWALISNAVATRLDIGGHVSRGGKLLVSGNDLLVFWIDDSANECRMAGYRDLSWSTPVTVLAQVSDLMPGVRDTGTKKEVFIVYRATVDDGLKVAVSSDGGSTWPDIYEQGILFSGDRVQYSHADQMGTLHLLIVNRDKGGGRLYRCSEGWVFEYTGVELGSGPDDQLDGRFQGHLSADRSQVVATLESGNGNVTVHGSIDGGTTFETLDTFDGQAWCPVLDEEKRYLAYVRGMRLNIYRFVTGTTGRMISHPVSPMGISSWDDFGFDVEGFGAGSELNMRIFDKDGITQLFPASGYLDVLSLGPGHIEGIDQSHYGRFSGDWTSGGTLVESIILDITAKRAPEDLPGIMSITLNHTNSFPINESLMTSVHVVSITNMTYTASGYTLQDQRTEGRLVIGPLEMENGWCDVMGIDAYSSSDDASFSAGILDNGMRPVSGFTTKDSVRVSQTDGMNFMRWGDSFLKDLPGTIHTIYLVIEVSSENTLARPYLKGFLFDDSEDPVIDRWEIDAPSVLRGKATTLHFWVSDREEPDEMLSLMVSVRDPVTGDWSNEMERGQLWSGDHWALPLQTAYSDNIGSHDVSVMVRDTSGSSRDYFLGPILELRNNPPAGPGIYIVPEAPTSGDELSVEIYRKGTDLETSTEDIIYNYRFFRDSDLYMEVLETASLNARIEEGVVREGEEWKVEVTSFDGVNESTASVSSIFIFNTAPALIGHPDSITILEDHISEPYDHLSWFSDKDGEQLDVEFHIDEGVKVVPENGSFRLRPGRDMNGRALLTVLVSDEEGSARANVPIIVVPVNDPPVIENVSNASVLQGKWLNVTISAHDLRDGEDISVENDIPSSMPGVSPGVNYMVLPNGTFRLLATNDMVGNHTVTITATDSSSSVNMTFRIEVLNINDAPMKPYIHLEPDRKYFMNGERLILKAEAFDPDLPWGDSLEYRWSSDLSGPLGDLPELNTMLHPGIHLITIKVTDSTGLSNSSSVRIVVSENEEPKKDVMDTTTFLMIVGGAAFLTGLLVSVLVYIIVAAKRKDANRTEELQVKDQDD